MQKKAEVKVTIFIHGTHRFQYVVPQGLKKIFDFLYCKPGLYKPIENPEQNCYQWVLANLIKFNENLLDKEHTYLFCWSGQLSHKARVQASEELNNAITELLKKYLPDYEKVTFQLIAHSHGGNVILNLVNTIHTIPYTIDTVILLAVPVQGKTEEYIEHPLFKKIYALYSSFDMMQVLDPQGLHDLELYISQFIKIRKSPTEVTKKLPLFSKRNFGGNKVFHIHITHKSRPITHIEFLLPHFLKHLSHCIARAALSNTEKKQTYNCI